MFHVIEVFSCVCSHIKSTEQAYDVVLTPVLMHMHLVAAGLPHEVRLSK